MAPRRRGPNHALRAERIARGWTTERVAQWINTVTRKLGYLGLKPLTRHGYERYETLGVVPDDPRLKAICMIFEKPATDLGFPTPPAVLQQPDEVLRLAAAGTAAQPLTDAGSIRTTLLPLLDSDEVNRRAFLSLVAAGAAGQVDLERLAAVLAGSRPNEQAFDDLETLTLELVRQEATLAAGSLLPAVRGHLQGFQDLLLWTTPSLTSRAHSLAGQTALLAGYLVFKLGRHTEADSYWSLANAFGDAAGDSRLRTAVAILQGWRLGGEGGAGDPDRAISLLHAAEPLATEPGVAAILSVLRAREHAVASEFDASHVVLALQDIEQADRHLGHTPANDGLYMLGSVEGQVRFARGMSFVYLERPYDAASDLEGILADIPADSLSWRSDVTALLAVVRGKMDAPEIAADQLGDALHLAVRAGAPRCMKRVQKYRQRWLSGFDGIAAVRRLDERIRALGLRARGSLLG